MLRPIALLACVFAFLLPSVAKAVDGDFALSLGYSHLHLDGSESFKDRDGVRFEPRVSFAFFEKVPELRLGFGLGISGYSHELNSNTIITINNGNDTEVIFADQWEGVSLLVPEFQISWRATLAGHDVWFIEPGVGVGAAFANYYVADNWWWGDENDNDTSEWDSTATVRPFVRAGLQGEQFMGGIEASYLFGGNIELTDQVHGDLNELYVGGFFGFRW